MNANRIVVVPGLLALAFLLNGRLVQGQEATRGVTPPADKRPCLVCGGAYHEEMEIIQYQGRWVFLCEGPCRQAWEADPDLFFAQLQGQGALFGEEQVIPGQIHYGWFYFGLYVLAGLVCGALCSYMAISRGMAATGWLAAGLLLNVIALLILAVFVKKPLLENIPKGARKIPATANPVLCPECKGENHPSAERCAQCGHALTPTVKAETNVIKSH